MPICGTTFGGQRDLRQTFENPLTVPGVVGVVIEDQLQIGEPENRERAQVHDARNPVHHDFERNGDLLLDLFGGDSRPLRDDLDVVIGDVGISFHGEIVERDRRPR